MTERAGDGMQERGNALKRRGILAAAGAVVAGMVAKQTAQPVTAANIAVQYSDVASSQYIGNGMYNPLRFFDRTGFNTTDFGSYLIDVYASYANSAVHGYGSVGILGESPTSIGVQGECDTAGGIGVVVASVAGVGVKGAATTGFPMIGQVVGPASINAGVLGVGTAGPGVQGQSNGHGLVGTTFATDGQHAALIGSVQPGGNAVALRGSIPPGASGLAGMFDGNVRITGTFVAPTMQAVVTHAGDKTSRLLHTMTSPEGWVEDFGEANLTNGTATVTLDPDFAAVVETAGYHVYLTEYGDHHNLFVATRNASGFVVQAKEASGTPTGVKAPTKGVSGTFGYRVVAKRQDITGERLAKVPPPPPLKPVTPFTVPETPEAKPPAKKP